jgi:hypothetical protein
MVPTNGSPVGLGFSYGGSHLMVGLTCWPAASPQRRLAEVTRANIRHLAYLLHGS